MADSMRNLATGPGCSGVFEDVFTDELRLTFCEQVPHMKQLGYAGIIEQVMTEFDVVSCIEYDLKMRVRFCASDDYGLVDFSLVDVGEGDVCKQLEALMRANGYRLVMPFTHTPKAKLIRAAIMFFDDMENYLRFLSPCDPQTAGDLKLSDRHLCEHTQWAAQA